MPLIRIAIKKLVLFVGDVFFNDFYNILQIAFRKNLVDEVLFECPPVAEFILKYFHCDFLDLSEVYFLVFELVVM